MKNHNNKKNSSNSQDIRTKHLILKELLDIVEVWHETPISRHLVCILRPAKDVYDWSNEELLKKIETYRFQLETDSGE